MNTYKVKDKADGLCGVCEQVVPAENKNKFYCSDLCKKKAHSAFNKEYLSEDQLAQIKESIEERAERFLLQMRKAPSMWALTKESYINRVCSIVEMVDPKFEVREFYRTHLKLNGSVYAKASENVWDEDDQYTWAVSVIDDAIRNLKLPKTK